MSIYLTQARLRTSDAPTGLINAFIRAFGVGTDGQGDDTVVKLSVPKLLLMHAEYVKMGYHILDLNDISRVVLQNNGQSLYYRWQDSITCCEHVIECDARIDAAYAKFHADRARWRRKWATQSQTNEARDELRGYEARRNARIANARRRLFTAHARRFIEIASDDAYVSPGFRTKPLPLTQGGQFIVTVETLRNRGACSEYCGRFRRTFPDGSPITPEICTEHYQVFDWHWAAEQLLDVRVGYRLWTDRVSELSQELQTERRGVEDEYNRTTTDLRDAHDQGKISSTTFHRKLDVASQNYAQKITQLDQASRRARAQAFGELFQKHPYPHLIH